ncbi:MAG TPA: hypothetical protein VEZ26_11410 [Sphingomonadaceae bacterium]|uniref:hypothetical protein n=1 Tax=unclassified Sphingobium TaxID=2611147 RepID=UPI0022258526|nr:MULTISPECIES: hypothetical protein [unclassified Sphingobium]MCW2370881.1 hypothetical protein [Sphingobium sp. B11D3D]MCW2413377.1 hypothetical protein [Sphingobium sp. B8D3D]MCW2414324.1 hypothetical protein [Sphingobium sp. B8D3A]HZF46939.1 hypothetical protein [Sphingomonadaceae bacterium]
MTQSQLADILIARLVRDHGGTRQRWRKVVGPIRIYDLRTHPHCNWMVDATGSTSDIAKVESLLDELRQNHPIITADR